MAEISHVFDWYQATVPAHQELLCRELLSAMHGMGVSRQDGRGMSGYTNSVCLVSGDDTPARILHGGPNPHPNVLSTGGHAPSLATLLRTVFPTHKVSRCDVAIDMRGDGLFGEISDRMRACGRRHHLKGSRMIPDDPNDGATYYLGSPKSPLRVRLYEKGKQLFKETGDTAYEELFDWTRLELQVRPQKDFKSKAAVMEPDAFWGCSKWTRELSAEALGLSPDAVTMKPTRLTDQERAMRALAQQYGPTIRRQIEQLGSAEAFLGDLLVRLGLDGDQTSTSDGVKG